VSNLKKIAILGIDALEYDFIEPRNYPSLKRTNFGKMEIPKSCISGDEPLSPEVWATIFTGLTYKEHQWGFNTASKYKPVKNDKLKVLTGFGLGKIFPFISKKIARENPFLLKYKTFFNFFENPMIIKMPTGDYRWKLDFDALEYIHAGKFNELINSAEKKHINLSIHTSHEIRKDWDIFFTYFNLLDYVGHIYWKSPNLVEKYYNMIEKDVFYLNNLLPKDTILIVVSDHGMMNYEEESNIVGIHSHHAYISINRDIELPTNILDFYSFIERLSQ